MNGRSSYWSENVFDESASYTLFDVTDHVHGQGQKMNQFCVNSYRDPINIYTNHTMIISFDSLLEKQLSVIISLIRPLHKGPLLNTRAKKILKRALDCPEGKITCPICLGLSQYISTLGLNESLFSNLHFIKRVLMKLGKINEVEFQNGNITVYT